MSRNEAFSDGAGRPVHPKGASPKPLTERHPMLFDPGYDAPEEHQNYSASGSVSGEVSSLPSYESVAAQGPQENRPAYLAYVRDNPCTSSMREPEDWGRPCGECEDCQDAMSILHPNWGMDDEDWEDG